MILSNARFVVGVERSWFKNYNEKKTVLVRYYVYSNMWLKMKLHMHLHRIAILTDPKHDPNAVYTGPKTPVVTGVTITRRNLRFSHSLPSACYQQPCCGVVKTMGDTRT